MTVSHRWKRLKEQLLKVSVPRTLVSWRFLLPGQSKAIQLHRKVFLGALASRPRWQWALISIYGSMAWLFFFSWQQIFLCMKEHSQKLTAESDVSTRKQLLDLLQLAILHGIPPGDYFDYRLFHRPKKQWFEYIYSHELIQWHQVLSSAGASQETMHLMTDKKDFAEQMVKWGITSVETYDFFIEGERLETDRVFTERSVFLKPNTGYRGEGCLTLAFDRHTGCYQLSGDEVFTSQDDILAEINRRVKQRGYLMQPLLQNHPLIIDFCGASKLVTLRLVSAIIKGEPVPLFASLNIPCLEEVNDWWWLDIGLNSGQLFYGGDTQLNGVQKIMQRAGEKSVPCWQESVDICLNAHRQLSDLPTIGWDVVITSSGVKLLEGNVCWGIDGYQFKVPALGTPLIEAYQ